MDGAQKFISGGFLVAIQNGDRRSLTKTDTTCVGCSVLVCVFQYDGGWAH